MSCLPGAAVLMLRGLLPWQVAAGAMVGVAAVVLNGRDEAKPGRAVADLCEAEVAAERVAFDVTDGAAVEAGVVEIEEGQGPSDILVNHAGIQVRKPLAEFPEADWRAVIETYLTGVFLVARRMIARKAGKIINICSLMSEVGRPTIAPYTAAKGAVKMLTKGMCADWAPMGLQVNGIGPGSFATEMNQALIDDRATADCSLPGSWGPKDRRVIMHCRRGSFADGMEVLDLGELRLAGRGMAPKTGKFQADSILGRFAVWCKHHVIGGGIDPHDVGAHVALIGPHCNRGLRDLCHVAVHAGHTGLLHRTAGE